MQEIELKSLEVGSLEVVVRTVDIIIHLIIGLKQRLRYREGF